MTTDLGRPARTRADRRFGGESQMTALYSAVERSDFQLARLLIERAAEHDDPPGGGGGRRCQRAGVYHRTR